jgi:trehalose-6-phosphate synthase
LTRGYITERLFSLVRHFLPPRKKLTDSNTFSAGGLVTAVAPVVIDCNGIWVGWTGLHDFNTAIEKIPESEPDDTAPTAGLLSNQA